MGFVSKPKLQAAAEPMIGFPARRYTAVQYEQKVKGRRRMARLIREAHGNLPRRWRKLSDGEWQDGVKSVALPRT